MEGTLLVTPEVLRSTASDFQNKATAVKSLHDTMLTKVQGLSASWTGTAAEAYNAKFTALKPGMEKIYNMISEHVRDLNDMADEYTKAETNATAAAENLPGSTL